MGKFFNLFKRNKSKSIEDRCWVEAKVNNTLKFQKYKPKGQRRLQSLAGEIVFVAKISDFFYLVKDKKTLIFFADFEFTKK